jgi:exodeoxyribonuclease V gamma subunit
LALSAAWPERPFEAVTIGRARDGARRAKVTTATIRALGGDPGSRQAAAIEHLRTLVDLYRRNLREPLPLYCKTTAAWATAAHEGREPSKAANGAWTSEYNYPREDQDAEHQLVLAGVVSFDWLLSRCGAPRDDERGEGWDDSEPTRFGRYARRLWDGLLDHEQLVDL